VTKVKLFEEGSKCYVTTLNLTESPLPQAVLNATSTVSTNSL